MAVDTEKIKEVYDALSTLAKDTAQEFIDKNALSEVRRAEVISSTINVLITTSVSAVLDEPVKSAQKEMIVEQKNVEVEKKELTIRQKDFYDDQLRIKEAEQLSAMVQMALVSGATVATDMIDKTYTAIAAITQYPQTT